MTLLFDLTLLLGVSGSLAFKNLYLGITVLIMGLLVGFQSERLKALLGEEPIQTNTSRKVKAFAVSIILGGCFIPILQNQVGLEDHFEKIYHVEILLPLIVLIGLFSAAMISAVATEKRKR